jgi:hypothetical protein
VLPTPSEYTQSLIVCRSRHRSIGRIPLRIREALGALRPRPRNDDVRANLGSTEVGALESVHTLTTGCSSALTSRQRGARARSGTRVLRTHAPKPSVAEQGPPGEAAFGPARSRRKIGIGRPRTAQRARGARQTQALSAPKGRGAVAGPWWSVPTFSHHAQRVTGYRSHRRE